MWRQPTPTSSTPLPKPTGTTGVRLLFPSPAPTSPPPQHFTPPFWSAQACEAWIETLVTPLSRPGGATGVLRAVVVPSPSRPPVFWPQQRTPPETTAQPPPAEPPPLMDIATSVTPAPRPDTGTGSYENGVVRPSPSEPLVREPQHDNPPAEEIAQPCASPAAIVAARDAGAAIRMSASAANRAAALDSLEEFRASMRARTYPLAPRADTGPPPRIQPTRSPGTWDGRPRVAAAPLAS